MYLSPRKKLFVDAASEKYGGGNVLSKAEVKEVCDDLQIPLAGWFLGQHRIGYNQFKLPSEPTPDAVVKTNVVSNEENAVVNLVATNMEKQNLVPALFEGFVAWGNFSKIVKIIKSV